jgi:hypothetical protein
METVHHEMVGLEGMLDYRGCRITEVLDMILMKCKSPLVESADSFTRMGAATD